MPSPLVDVRLRPIVGVDLGLLHGGDSEFDDFGPRPVRTEPPSPDLRSGPGGLAVVDPASHAVLGMVSWVWQRWGPNPESASPMIGVWLRREARGRGVGTAAQAALVDLFFERLRLHRVEAHTDVDNLVEQRALERIGFRREGVVRGAQWRRGAWHDGWLYSLLREEWLAAREGSAPTGG
ncbi:GNAT family N-acetyltransferase [Nocardioides sp. TRM66260-LWL]|uniref:GNAT family N-acetyltransferase n=1 Tax=Nocardioides sp. TRM66260-LWL TaxID=2874478 RepID=UPI001CC3D4FC|nr:GNAT family protein [Nocardioides sp. TRM66260-LWL]MBZ5732914.1 GNAT family N-acetyltransferase [Nocardioides sp. TRM66260-LWL]